MTRPINSGANPNTRIIQDNDTHRTLVCLLDSGTISVSRQFVMDGEWVYDQECGAMLLAEELAAIDDLRNRSRVVPDIPAIERVRAPLEKRIFQLEADLAEARLGVKKALELFDSEIFTRAWRSPITDLGYMQDTGEVIEFLRSIAFPPAGDSLDSRSKEPK